MEYELSALDGIVVGDTPSSQLTIDITVVDGVKLSDANIFETLRNLELILEGRAYRSVSLDMRAYRGVKLEMRG